MELMFDNPRYIIDASSMITQKNDELFRRSIYKQLWDNIDALIRDHIIVTCSEIVCELKDDIVTEWFKNQDFLVLPICDTVQENVRTVVTSYPKLINFREMKSSGDAFLIATAMKYSLTVITEENPKKENRIPFVCKSQGVPCINILGLCENENWHF